VRCKGIIIVFYYTDIIPDIVEANQKVCVASGIATIVEIEEETDIILQAEDMKLAIDGIMTRKDITLKSRTAYINSVDKWIVWFP